MDNLHEYLENNKVFLAKVIHFIDYANTELDEKCLEGPKISKYNGHYEINNFKKREDGKVYGFVAKAKNRLSIENFGADKKDSFVENCLVIFISDASQVVGYYKNAIIYRDSQSNNFSDYYFFEVDAKDAVIIAPDNRWDIKLSDLNFGQAQRKYVDEGNKKRYLIF